MFGPRGLDQIWLRYAFQGYRSDDGLYHYSDFDNPETIFIADSIEEFMEKLGTEFAFHL
jgi:hypothetical protein